jgi:curved DNA-binding protein CbpA
MTDPYKILGVSSNASDEEIKTAYRKLTQQYHPDRQNDSVMEDIANEKMAQINAAYDEIMNLRRGNTQSSYNLYEEIRINIENGNYTKADEMLEKNRNDGVAEWNYLKGTVCLSRGWLNDAYTYFEKAVRLEPSNREYQMALGQLRNQRNGSMNGNPYTSPSDNTCNTLCNICQCLICADCICDCF